MAKKRKKKHDLFIRILQNGHPVCETTWPLSKSGLVSLTSDYKSELSIPLYPMTEEITVAQVKKRQVHLRFNLPWKGFFTSGGVTKDFNGLESESMSLKEGDYGSFSHKDLRILLKIQQKADPQGTHVFHESFHFGFFKLFFASRIEVGSFISALLFASIISLGFILGLFNRPMNRPMYFEELDPAYQFPFVGKKHLVTSPEALQENLDRTNYLMSTIRYYRSLTELLMGWKVHDKSVIFKPTLERYKRREKKVQSDIRESRAKQLRSNQKAMARQATAIFSIPSVVGIAFQKRLIDSMSKIELHQDSLSSTLDSRRKVTSEYKDDPTYDWGDYRSRGVQNKKLQEYLSKIKPFDRANNETLMYSKAVELGNLAESRRRRVFGPEDSGELLNQIESTPILIPDGVQFVSFLRNASALISSDKISKIHASEYGKSKKHRPREPLIGEIDPKLISRTVNRKRFQLQLCYELALRRNQFVHGQMKWQWRIDTRGKIYDISLLNTTIRDRKMVRCIRNKMAAWHFPRPRRGSVEVTHSFQFYPQKG